MNKPVQFIITPSGERLVVLPEEDFLRLSRIAETLAKTGDKQDAQHLRGGKAPEPTMYREVCTEEDRQRLEALQEQNNMLRKKLETALEDVEDLKALVDGLRRDQAGEELLTLDEVEKLLDEQTR